MAVVAVTRECARSSSGRDPAASIFTTLHSPYQLPKRRSPRRIVLRWRPIPPQVAVGERGHRCLANGIRAAAGEPLKAKLAAAGLARASRSAPVSINCARDAFERPAERDISEYLEHFRSGVGIDMGSVTRYQGRG